MKKNISINDVIPLIEETVNNDGKFRLYPKGISMSPLIREGKDSVLLEKCKEIKKNDILLYRRKNGSFVLHRVVADGENLAFCGDNQHVYEYGITQNDVIAKVSGIYRKEKLKRCDTFSMKLYLKYVILRRKKRIFFRLVSKFLKRKFSR